MLESTNFICEHDRHGCPYCAEKITELVDEVKRLRTALEHYADELKWNGSAELGDRFGQDGQSLYTFGGSCQNGYDVAKAALEKSNRD